MLSDSRTSTAEALLGMLSLQPMSGYELRQMISDSIGNFWSESFGQIYPTLKRMEGDGLISAKEGDRAGSKIYSLTEAGWVRLREWIPTAARPSVPRNELLLKLFFGNLVSIEHACRHLREERERAVSDLDRYQAIEDQLKSRRDMHPGLPFWLATVRYGLAESKALLFWCDQTLATFTAADSVPAAQEMVQ